MDGLLELLEDRRLPNNGGSQADLDAFVGRLTTAMQRMKRLRNKFMDNIIPMHADLLLEYHRPEINNQLDDLIANIKTNKRRIGLNKRTKEYRELQRQKKDKEITLAEFNQLVLDLNVQQLQSRKIGRETLITELREAQKNKTWASMMLDPMIYSSQTALQMFATHLKSSIYAAADQSRNTKYRLRDIYREYAESRGLGLDDSKFNEPILEEHSYYVTDWEASKQGKIVKKKINVLSFVQPIDVGKYYAAEFEAVTDLAKKYKRPESQEELKTWQTTAEAKKYYQGLNKWYKENSVPLKNEKGVEIAQKELNKLTDKLASLKKDWSKAVNAVRRLRDVEIGEADYLNLPQLNIKILSMKSLYLIRNL